MITFLASGWRCWSGYDLQFAVFYPLGINHCCRVSSGHVLASSCMAGSYIAGMAYQMGGLWEDIWGFDVYGMSIPYLRAYHE